MQRASLPPVAEELAAEIAIDHVEAHAKIVVWAFARLRACILVIELVWNHAILFALRHVPTIALILAMGHPMRPKTAKTVIILAQRPVKKDAKTAATPLAKVHVTRGAR